MIMTDNTFFQTTSPVEVYVVFKASHCGGGILMARRMVQKSELQERVGHETIQNAYGKTS